MNEKWFVPLSEVLKPPVVERSWSEDVPADVGVNAPIEPMFSREQAILKAVAERYK